MTILAMPRLSDTMEEGTIVAWLVQPGAAVAVGDELVEIESDKATMTVQAELEGPLTVLAAEGDAVMVGEPIAWIGEGAPDDAASASDDVPSDGAVAGSGGAADGAAATVTSAAGPVAEDSSSRDGGGPASDVAASPVARRAARRLGVDLGAVAGSGPRGRVLKADVEAHVAAPAAASAPASAPTGLASSAVLAGPTGGDPRGDVELVPLTRVQRTIADRMVTAKTAPEFVVEVDVDMSQAVALRAELKAAATDAAAANGGAGASADGTTAPVVPSFNDFVVRAAALALRDHPEANAAYHPDGFQRFSRVNVGVAVAAEGTLVVPTVFDADRKSLAAVAADVRRLAAKVRDGAIEPADLSGGTFTVSNLGMFGVDRFVAVLNPPQSAILAVGRMATQPAWDDATEAFVPRPTVRLSLTCDHRILYGADAARLLSRIRERLERPLLLAL